MLKKSQNFAILGVFKAAKSKENPDVLALIQGL